MAEYITNAGNTNRFKFSSKFSPNRENGEFTPSTTALSHKSQLFVPMVFSLDLPGVTDPPPPLILYITPSDISIQRRKVVAEHYLRSGPLREEWGNELDVWNCSGWMAAFYKGLSNEETKHQPINPVITQIDRDDTAGYQNFISLLSFYKNNGRTYYDRGISSNPQRNQLGTFDSGRQIIDNRNLAHTTEIAYVNVEENGQQKRIPIQAKMTQTEGSKAYRNRVQRVIRATGSPQIRSSTQAVTRPSRQIRHVGSVVIAYDMRVLLGHFDTFEWTESVENPYQIKYAFTFVVKAQYDMAAQWSGQGTIRG